MVRGTGEAEKLLKNAKTELWNEMEEIGNYLAIEELANALYDQDTAKLAREFRRQEERMASFLQKLIPQLAKQVVRDEVPARERKPAATATNGGRTRSTASRPDRVVAARGVQPSVASRSTTRPSRDGLASSPPATAPRAADLGAQARGRSRRHAQAVDGPQARVGLAQATAAPPVVHELGREEVLGLRRRRSRRGGGPGRRRVAPMSIGAPPVRVDA